MMNEMKTGVYTYMTKNGEESINFNFYTDLSVADKLKFVNFVTSLVVDEDRYNSVIRDLVFDFYIVDIMTDINTIELKSSDEFINDVEDFLLSTNIVEIVKANAFPSLFDELNKAVDLNIQYLTGIHKNQWNDALADLIAALEKRISGVDLDAMMNMAKKFANMTGELTADSVVSAYMNSEIHNKNLNEVAEAKKNKTGKSGKKTKKDKVEVTETEKVIG